MLLFLVIKRMAKPCCRIRNNQNREPSNQSGTNFIAQTQANYVYNHPINNHQIVPRSELYPLRKAYPPKGL